MRRYFYVAISPKRFLAIIILTLLLASLSIVFLSLTDWQVSGLSKEPTVYMQYFVAAMGMVGFSVGAILWLINPSRLGPNLFATVFGATILLIVSSLEDVLYFYLGQGYLPPENVNWNWMWQGIYFNHGWWDNNLELLWCFSWIAIMIAYVTAMIWVMWKKGNLGN